MVWIIVLIGAIVIAAIALGASPVRRAIRSQTGPGEQWSATPTGEIPPKDPLLERPRDEGDLL